MRKKLHTLSFLLTSYCLFTIGAFAQPGFLDPSFSFDGMFTTGTSSNEYGRAGTIQSDGKILIAGSAGNGANFNFVVLRLNNDGTLDNSFDTDGMVTTTIDSLASEAFAIALQTDGKIVVGGYHTTSLFAADFALVRYNTDGSLDNTFSTDGIVTTDFAGSSDYIRAVQVQSDGKILVAGYASMGTTDFALARYNTDGTLDISFDGDGKLTTDFLAMNDFIYDMTIQSDDKILVVGSVNNGTNTDFGLARYNTDGSLDNTFDTDGKVISDLSTQYDEAISVALRPDNRIVVGGTANFPGNGFDFLLARYNINGSLDNSFGISGMITTHYGAGDDNIKSVSIQGDGSIVAIGKFTTFNDEDFGVAMYDSIGYLDTGFEVDGKVAIDFGDGDDFADGGFIQPDGKIVAIGRAKDGSDFDFSVARLEGTLIGVDENSLVDNMSIYPNPATNYVTISSSAEFVDMSMQLVNTTGQVMLTQKNINGNSFMINISTFAAGTYFLELNQGSNTARIKVIKK